MWTGAGKLPERWEIVPGRVMWSSSANGTITVGIRILDSSDRTGANIHLGGGCFSRGMVLSPEDRLVYYRAPSRAGSELSSALPDAKEGWRRAKENLYGAAKMASRNGRSRSRSGGRGSKPGRGAAGNIQPSGEENNQGVYDEVFSLLNGIDFTAFMEYESLSHTLFLKAKGSDEILSVYHPLLPLLPDNAHPETIKQSVRSLQDSMALERWTGAPVLALQPEQFGGENLSPAAARAAEREGKAVSLLSMDLRFRSFPGIHHCVTHYLPEKKAFRVLTARAGADGGAEGCFPSAWNGEDVLYYLFKDRFPCLSRGLTSLGDSWKPSFPMPEGRLDGDDSPVFAFLRFCEREDAGRGESVLDRHPTARVSGGYREVRPLFPTLVTAFVSNRVLLAERIREKPSDRRNAILDTGLNVFRTLGRSASMGKRWVEPNTSARDEFRKEMKSMFPEGKYKSGSIFSKDHLRKYIGSLYLGRGEFRFIPYEEDVTEVIIDRETGKRKNSARVLDLVLGDVGDGSPGKDENVPVHTFFSSSSYLDRMSAFGLVSVPVVDVRTGQMSVREREVSARSFMLLKAPELYNEFFSGLEITGEDISFLTSEMLGYGDTPLEGLRHIYARWFAKSRYYLPEAFPLPGEMPAGGIDPCDALAFISRVMPFMRLAAGVAEFVIDSDRRRFLSSRGSSIPAVYGDDDGMSAQELLIKGLAEPPDGSSIEDSALWLERFRLETEDYCLTKAARKRFEENEKNLSDKSMYSLIQNFRLSLGPVQTADEWLGDIQAALENFFGPIGEVLAEKMIHREAGSGSLLLPGIGGDFETGFRAYDHIL